MNIKYKLFAMFSLGVFVLPFMASAQTLTVAQLQAQIQSLTAELQILEGQLAAAGGSTTTWCHTFNTNISFGMSGSEVTALQTALQKDGESVSVTGTFDEQTASAVSGFQEKYASQVLSQSGLQHGTGYVGRSTRNLLNSLFGCGVVTAPVTINPQPPTPPTSTSAPAGSLTASLGVNNYPLVVNAGQVGSMIGNYTLTASSAESVELSTLNILVNSSFFQNVRVYVNAVQFGGALPSGNDQFTGASPIRIPAGGYVYIQVFADISPSASGAISSATILSGCSAIGATTNTSISCNSVSGPNLSFISQTASQAPTPYITLVDSASNLVPGGAVTLDGANFDSGSTVDIDGTQTINPGAYASSYFDFMLPSNISLGTHTMWIVEKGSGATSNQISFTVKPGLSSANNFQVLSPVAGQSFTPGGAPIVIHWTPAAQGVAEIDLVPTDGSWPNHGEVIYSMKVLGYATNYSGQFSFPVPPISSQTIPAGSYYLAFYNPANYSGANQGPGTLIGQSGVFTISEPTAPAVGSLTANQNSAFGNQTISAGLTGQKIGSYTLTASSVEGINVNSLTVMANSANFQNLKILVNGVQFGVTQAVVNGGSAYTFSGTPFTVGAGLPVNVDIYADTLSSAVGSVSPATVLTNTTGIGQTSFTSISLAGPVNGQSVSFNASFNGQSALTIATDPTNPPAGQVLQNSTGNILAVYRFTETSNLESVKVAQLTVVDLVAMPSIKPAFSNVSLYNGSTLLGTAAAPSAYDPTTGGYDYVFNSFPTSLIVPQDNSVSLTLKGNAGSQAAGSITDNSKSTFAITAPSMVVARGMTSNKVASITLSNATGNPQTILRTTLNVAGATIVPVSPSLAQIGSITFTANTAGDAELNTLKLTFSGNALQYGASTFLNTVTLKNSSGNNIVNIGNATISNNGSNTVSWTFSSSNPIVVAAGSSYTLQLWGDTSVIPAQANIAENLSAQITGINDFTYLDGTNDSPTVVNLPTNAVPITVVSLSGGFGQQPTQTPTPVAPAISISLDPSWSNGMNVHPGLSHTPVASFILTAPTSSAVGVYDVTVNPGALPMANMSVMWNGYKVPQTQAVVTAGQKINFNFGAPFVLNAGQSATLVVYADISNAATLGTYAPGVYLTNADGQPVGFSGSFSGQPVNVGATVL